MALSAGQMYFVMCEEVLPKLWTVFEIITFLFVLVKSNLKIAEMHFLVATLSFILKKPYSLFT